MSRGILDADMATVGRWLSAGWRWWISELAGLLPSGFGRRGTTARGTVAWFTRDAPLTVTRGGRSIEPRTGSAAAVALAPELCLLRTVTLPALPDADLRRLVALQIDRLMPFTPGEALFDLIASRSATPPTQVDVTIAALPASLAGEIAAAASAANIAVASIGLAYPDSSLRFDFLPALRAARGEPPLGAGRRFWWRVVAVLFVLNLVLLIATDMLALRNEARLIEAHGESADLVRAVRRRVIAEDATRRTLITARATHDPLSLLADLSRRMPTDAWVQRLTLDNGQVRLTGFRRNNADVLGALRVGGTYQNVHVSTPDVLAFTPEGQPFDISFDLPGPQR